MGAAQRAYTAGEWLDDIARADCQDSLLAFVREFWHVVDPSRPLVEGPTLDAICQHLEAVTDGRLTRLLINVPPGSLKTNLTNVFWPMWEWTLQAKDRWAAAPVAAGRYVTFSYSAEITEGANRNCLAILQSDRYKELFGGRFSLLKVGETLISNSKTGFKHASSVGGVGTGKRGDRIILDDPHNVKEGESQLVRTSTVEWFRNTMSNRLNDADKSAIVVIMQRVHEDDVSGFIIANNKRLGYEVLTIPAEYDPRRHCRTSIGWEDWRKEEGELFWPDRYSLKYLRSMAATDWAYAGQYQQDPEPRGGGIIKRDYWRPWTEPRFPPFSFLVAALDTAYGEKQESDFSALTIWGVFAREGVQRAMLVYGWQERLTLHELVKRVVRDCGSKRFGPEWPGIDRLLIEDKTVGRSLSQELYRLYAGRDWGIVMVDPGGRDKVMRVNAVEHLFFEGLVWVPHRDGRPRAWAQPVIDQFAKFPKASHDDLVDSGVYALSHLRAMGALTNAFERESEEEELLAQRPQARKLYPV